MTMEKSHPKTKLTFDYAKTKKATSERIAAGLDHYFQTLQTELAERIKENFVNPRVQQRKTERLENGIESAKALCLNIMADYGNRAYDVESAEVKQAIKLAEQWFRIPVYGTFCTDSRLQAILMAGFVGGFGGFLKRPGGNFPECVEAGGGELELRDDKKAYFTRLLREALADPDVKIITEIFDSHMHCKAAEESALREEGLRPNDGGLLEDVKTKKRVISALKQWVENTYRGEKTVVAINFSFNPENGAGFMGLEKDDCLKAAEQAEGFTPEVLKNLAAKNKIISTETLANDPGIKKTLEQAKQKFELNTIDWKIQYAKSSLNLWQAIDSFAAELLPKIKEKISVLYPELVSEDQELHQRAMVILANTFCHYANNLNGYQYSTHQEKFVRVAERHFGPHASIDAFRLETDAEQSHNIDFVANLIREFRAKEKPERKPSDQGSAEAKISQPIIVTVEALVRGELTEEIWNTLSLIDWSKLSAVDWFSPEIFNNFVTQQLKQTNILFTKQ